MELVTLQAVIHLLGMVLLIRPAADDSYILKRMVGGYYRPPFFKKIMRLLIKEMLLGIVFGITVAVPITYFSHHILGIFFPCVNSEICIVIKYGLIMFFVSSFSLFVAQILVHKQNLLMSFAVPVLSIILTGGILYFTQQ